MIIRRINHKYKNFELDIENLEIGNNKIIGLIGENVLVRLLWWIYYPKW